MEEGMEAQKPTPGTIAINLSSRERVHRDADEAIVRLDSDGDYAEVWTQRRGLAVRLKRLGFVETDRQGRGVWLRGRVRQISFRKPAPVRRIRATTGNLAALSRAREALRRQREAPAGTNQTTVREAVRE